MKARHAAIVAFAAIASTAYCQSFGTAPVAPSVSPPPLIPPQQQVAVAPGSVPVPAQLAQAGETSITLKSAALTATLNASRITVPLGEKLTVTAPDLSNLQLGPVQWYKDNQKLAGATDRVLIIDSVKASDAGVYVANYAGNVPLGLQFPTLILAVGPTPRFLALSARALVGPGEATFITGFTVTGSQAKKVLLRAIGPTLATFGVKSPLAQPTLQVYDQQGKLYANAYVYPAVVGGPTYEQDLADALAKCGAFALPANTKDVQQLRPFDAGNYSVHVSSADNSTGVVLVEIYEVP